MSLDERRAAVRRWLLAGVEAVDPEERTAAALSGSTEEPVTVIAIGKAAAAMCRGAARALTEVTGVCVTNAPGGVPDGIELLIGDHPVPDQASFAAGERVLRVAEAARGPCVALISGGGSALCEQPRPGIDVSFIQMANTKLLDSGASIEDTNLVRTHLSAIKAGGLARAVRGSLDTYIISDVSAAGPEVVASGPTIPIPQNPEGAREVMERIGIALDEDIWRAMSLPAHTPHARGAVVMLADGRIAAAAVAEAAQAEGVEASVRDGWLSGDVQEVLRQFLEGSGTGVTIAAGEPNVEVPGRGIGGRNSHAALMAAGRLAATDDVFAAFATDGVDGRSDGAGAIVDGTTISRGGDPSGALADSDSASYLDAIGDLIRTGPTGTNVSDLWLLWRV